MKRILAQNKPTLGLAKYLAAVGADANWDGFRDHNAGASYSERIEKLIDVQHGLCGYCEINLTELDLQIEHVIPRGDPQQGVSREVDVTSMIACCKGGTSAVFASSERSSDEDRYLEPVKDYIAILNHLRDIVYCFNLGKWKYFFCRIPLTNRSLSGQYATDVTDAQWRRIEPLLPPSRWQPGGPGRPPRDRR